MRPSLAKKVGVPLLLLALGGLGALGVCAQLLLHAAAHEDLSEMLTGQRLLADQLGLSLAHTVPGNANDLQEIAQALRRFDASFRTLWEGAQRNPTASPRLLTQLSEADEQWGLVKHALEEAGRAAPGPEAGAALADAEVSRTRLTAALEQTLTAHRAHVVGQRRTTAGVLVALGVFELGLLAVGAWLLHQSVLRPVGALDGTARRLRGGDFTARVALRGRDELASLGQTFNLLAEELGRRLAAVTGEREEARARLQTVLAQAPLVLFACDAEGRLTLAEGRALRRYDPTPERVLGRSIFEWEHKVPWLAEGVRRALSGEQAGVEGEYGGSVWAVQCAPLRAEEGEPAGVLMVGTDVSEARRAAAALQHSREELRAVLESIQGSIWAVDQKLQVMVANSFFASEFERIFGFPLQRDLLGRLREVAPELAAHWESLYTRALAGEHVITEEQSYEVEEQRRTYLVSIFPIRGTDGIRGVACAGTDITDRRKAEEALRQSEDRFSRVFHASPVPIIITAMADRRILDLNESALEATGYAREELVGRTTAEVGAWMEEEERLEALAELERSGGRIRQREVRLRRKDGSLFLALASFVVVRLAGQPCIVTMAQDITGYRRMEEQLRQTAKMEAIGQLAGGVAHDFNNILTVILSSSELLRRRRELGDRSRELVEQVVRAAHRGAALTRQLLAFSRKQTLHTVVLEPNDVVAEMETMLCRLIGEDVVLHTELAGDAGWVRADRSQLEQVLLNLAVNARDAMPHGGTLTLRTARVGREVLGSEVLSAGQAADDWVLLEVQDTGVGMSPEVLAHIFEPFFTTKEQGKGTGLGLATVYGIIRQSGGTVQVESAPGGGSTFRVLLPRVEPPPARAEPAEARAHATLGEETVLVVEDEEEVRRLLARVLSTHGYRVLCAEDGEKAVALVRAHPGPIHLLLTDMVMPHMRGTEVARRLRALRPGLRVLYMSGYPGAPQAEVLEGVPDAALLPKPFSVHVLLREVQAALGSGHPADSPGEPLH